MAHTTLISIPPEAFHGDSVPIVGGDGQAALSYILGAWVLAFDDPDEEAVLSPRYEMPGGYAGGTVKADLYVMFASEVTVTDEAVLDVSVEAVTTADALDLDAGRSFDSVNSIEVDPPATAGYMVKVTVTLTNADSVAAGDMVTFHIRRDTDAGADTCTGDAYILAFEVWEDA